MSGKKVLWQSVSAVRQRVIRAKTVKRGAELHRELREETERGARARLFPVSGSQHTEHGQSVSGDGREREADG